MNAHTDIFEMARTMASHLGRSDRARLVDLLICEYHAETGHTMPIPEFEDVKSDARAWASDALDDVLAIYLMAIFEALPQGRRDAAVRHLTEINKRGFADANP